MLSEHRRLALLRVAREAVTAEVTGRPAGPVDVASTDEASGVFVTLKRQGELRGCLGVLEMQRPLEQEVARCARDSASRDPRFPPVRVDELPDIALDISVLGPLEEIDPADARAIDIGRHGLVVEEGRQRGLLLPQVATEWGFDREQFLRQTCRKAGLPEDAWQHGARVYRFDAEVFGEESRTRQAPGRD